MALGGRMNLYQAVDSPMFTMRVLLSLIPLLFIAWSTNNADALPVQDKLPNSNEVLTKEQKDFMTKFLANLAELNMTIKDLETMDHEQLSKLSERAAFGLPPAREKSQCNFFWKTFSSC
ncbi:somatostatin 6 isoform X1 [Ictalurus furcatus]|uniref:somatostatin 6 isoform X1 n=2 Tax=Ictalurus furcatus TaxID=66913 RepID=UPI0023503C51|nr:somatostatin 6 isoform X1 [Ictalurus furcatus]XP_053500393.1 somatostatin 6 isoform X1 [Ictalurus furcatus]XP_053500394.1 somatostatin 6 isoform X1 [Ictalurus furcatus]